MAPAIILLLFLSLSLSVLWRIYDKDILSPIILIHISFIGALLLFLSGAERLEIKSFSPETAYLLAAGIISFSFGGMCAALSIHNRKRPYSGMVIHVPIEIKEYYYILLIVFSIIVAYVQYRHEVSVYGYASMGFTAVISSYRDQSVIGEVEGNLFVALSSRIVYVIQTMLIFTLCYNKIVCKEKIKHPIIVTIYLIILAVTTFIMAGSRGSIFRLLFQTLFSLSICYNFQSVCKNKGRKLKKLRGSKVWIVTATYIALISIPLFFYVGVLQGKKYDEMTLIEPIENYFSYGLIHLNHTVETGVYKGSEWGQWSFAGFYSMMNKFGAHYPSFDSVPFYSRYGNTLTLFGRWYQDFGYVGVIIMSIVSGMFFSILYYKMKYAQNIWESYKYSVLYVFFMMIIMMASYDDWIKGQLALNGIFQIILLLIMIKVVMSSMKKSHVLVYGY